MIQPKRKKVHGTVFKANSTVPKLIDPNFEYSVEPCDEGTRSANKTTKTQTQTQSQKNFMTTPSKTGYGSSTTGHLFSKHPEFIPDPYERKKQTTSNDWREHKRKLGKQPFQLSYRPKTAFTSNRELYSIPDGLPEHQQHTRQSDGRPAFLPSHPPKQGYNRTINKFPEYQLVPCTPEEKETKKEIPWRYTCTGSTLPSSSVNMYNSLVRPHTAKRL